MRYTLVNQLVYIPLVEAKEFGVPLLARPDEWPH
jgi:hypothetical protein